MFCKINDLTPGWYHSNSFHSLVAMHAQSKILAYKNQLQLPVTPSLWT